MSDAGSSPIRLVVFDLGGTAVDHGCMAPVAAFVAAFRELGIEVSAAQARGPMGLGKLDHVRALFQLAPVTKQWSAKYGRAWTEADVVATYERFLPLQTEIAKQHVDLIPGLLESLSAFARQRIAVAATTGYPREVAGPILDAVARAGFEPDGTVCADEVESGRPAPDMIHRMMSELQVDSPEAVVNVGDTVPDMQAARNAGVWAVGITESGSEFGLTIGDLAALPAAERSARHESASIKLRDAGAHAVIKSLFELPRLVELGSFQ